MFFPLIFSTTFKRGEKQIQIKIVQFSKNSARKLVQEVNSSNFD